MANTQNGLSFIACLMLIYNSKETLSDSQKFQYLKSKLKGQAAQLVTNYSLTDANYRYALDALKARYNNKRIIVNAHIKALFNQPFVKNETSAALRK